MTPRSESSGGKPLVSVVVRTRNRPEMLVEALESLRSQSYPNLEVVVVNDGGVDVEPLIEQTLAGHVVWRYIVHTRSRGRSNALNSGVLHADGEWIGFLDDDDLFLPQHVETLVNRVMESGAGIVYARAMVRELDTGPGERREFSLGEEFSYAHLLLENYIALISLLVHRQVLDATGLFDHRLDMFEDWDFLIRAGQHTRFLFVDRVTSYYRRHETSITVRHQADSPCYEQHRQMVWEKHFPVIRNNWAAIVAWCFDLHNRSLGLLQENDYFRKEALELHASIAELRIEVDRLSRELAMAQEGMCSLAKRGLKTFFRRFSGSD